MSENKSGIGEGILRGLKKIIFNPDESSANANSVKETSLPASPAAKSEPVIAAKPADNYMPSSSSSDKERRLKVYQLLEKMNRPGCDFFEVWNAAVEMGGANSNNIKAAYTSLRFADPSLSKAKLDESGNYYMGELKKILEAETARRIEEKSRLEHEKEQLKSNLVAEITSIEQEIKRLQEKLTAKVRERETLNEKYTPQISAIDEKITEGGATVNSVISEMQQVMQIIQQEIK
jgi:hypothetical protein